MQFSALKLSYHPLHCIRASFIRPHCMSATTKSQVPPVPSKAIDNNVTSSFTELSEGAAKALYSKGKVFYNPAQVVNRDLSILVLRYLSKTAKEPLKILEALSATGLRAIRYFKELPSVQHVIANDIDPSAVSVISRNVLYNNLLRTQVIPTQSDAIALLTKHRTRESRCHVIDLDPYGSAAPFLDPAVQAVSHGGILAVTCTDLPVLCGNSPEICYTRYSSTPLKGASTHEMAVRTVLAAVHAAANRHSRAVEPLICAKIDFYVRLFVRIVDSKSLAQRTPSQLVYVYQCSDCGTQRMQALGRIREVGISNSARKKRRMGPEKRTEKEKGSDVGKEEEGDNKKDGKKVENMTKTHLKYSPALVAEHSSSVCSICQGQMLLGGPIWGGALVNEEVSSSVMKEIEEEVGELKSRDRVGAIVRLLREEINVPLFMHLPTMCKVLRVSPPPGASMRAVLVKKGYKVSQSHTDPQAIKTDAPPELVWDILRLWVGKVGSPLLKKDAEIDGKDCRLSPGERILAKKAELIRLDEIDFSVKRDKFVRRGNGEVQGVRFPRNPEPNWGPKARAGKRQRTKPTESDTASMD